jgi:hypothetical protein
MVDEDQSPLKNALAKLRRKSEFQATAHASLRDGYELLFSVFTTISLVSGAFLLALILASPTLIHDTFGITIDEYQWALALLAVANFSIIIVLLSWRPNVRASMHDSAVRHYTEAGYAASNLMNGEVAVTQTAVNLLYQRYLEDVDLPRIPEGSFLRLKKWHLEKVAISRELDRNPHEALRVIRSRLRNQPRTPEAQEQTASENRR